MHGTWQHHPLVHVRMVTGCTESMEGGFLLDRPSLRLLPDGDFSLRLATPPPCAIHNKLTEVPGCYVVGVAPLEQAQPSSSQLFSMCVCL